MAENERQLGDVLSNIPTKMLKSIESLWNQFLVTYLKGDMRGFKYCGLGGLYISSSGISKNSDAKLYVYFYNSETTATLDGKEILPSFMSYDLSIDDSKIVAYGSSLSSVPEGGKEGQLLSVYTPNIGEVKIKFYFPQGVGTGNINSMCVSLVPLDKLKTLPAANAVFSGIVFEGSSYNPSGADRYFVPKILLSDNNFEGSLGIGQNISSGSSVVVYNISTGNFETVSLSLGKKPCWGLGRVFDGAYYFISSGTKLVKYDLATKTFTEGSSTTNLYHQNILNINNDLYVVGNSANVGSSMTLRKLNLTTLAADSSTYSFTVPDFGITGKGTILQFQNGDFGVIYPDTGIVFRFTDITDPTNSLVNVYFTGLTDIGCAIIPIEENGKVYFYGATNSGVYPSLRILANNSSSTKLHILSDAQVGSPLICYNKYNTSFEKTADTQLTTTTTISIP